MSRGFWCLVYVFISAFQKKSPEVCSPSASSKVTLQSVILQLHSSVQYFQFLFAIKHFPLICNVQLLLEETFLKLQKELRINKLKRHKVMCLLKVSLWLLHHYVTALCYYTDKLSAHGILCSLGAASTLDLTVRYLWSACSSVHWWSRKTSPGSVCFESICGLFLKNVV